MPDFLTAIIAEFQRNQFLSGATLGGIMLGLLAALRNAPKRLYTYLRHRFTVTISITSLDEMWDYTREWVAEHDFSRGNRRFRLVRVREAALDAVRSIGSANDVKLGLVPHNGNYWMRIAGKLVIVTCTRSNPVADSGSFRAYEEMSITYFGRSMKHGASILEAIRRVYRARFDRGVQIHTASYSSWNASDTLHPRPLETVVTCGDVAEKIAADVARFRERESWYRERGVPYHRGYLLHGAPGCGKTSTIYAVASHLKMPIYYLSLGGEQTESGFLSLMSDVKSGSMLVLEDVDALFANREEGNDGNKERCKVSFSTFLNAIDGFCAKDGVVLVMTTNYRDRLDPALIRPGRVDVQFEYLPFGPAEVSRMIRRYYDLPADSPALAALVDRIETPIVPAALQELLMQNETPEEAIAALAVRSLVAATPVNGTHLATTT